MQRPQAGDAQILACEKGKRSAMVTLDDNGSNRVTFGLQFTTQQ